MTLTTFVKVIEIDEVLIYKVLLKLLKKHVQYFFKSFFQKKSIFCNYLLSKIIVFSHALVLFPTIFFANFAGLVMSFKGMLKSFCFIGYLIIFVKSYRMYRFS